jgi:hypothetical protein
MNKFINLAAAAAVSVGGLAWVGTLRADDTAGQKVGNAVDNTKEKVHDIKVSHEDGRVYTVLGQVANDAMTQGDFKKLTTRFNDADHTRLKAWAEDKNNKEKLDQLDSKIAQFRSDWKAKYNQEFKIAKDDVVFGNSMFTVAQGEIGKDAELAGQKLPPADTNHPVTGGDRNLEKGRNVAIVTVAESHGLPELKVPLIHEMPDMWKIDVPDSVGGGMLYDNMIKHITMIEDHKDMWPADVNDAYRAVTHHVLMAILNVDKDSTGAGAAPGSNLTKPIEKK